MNNKISYGEGTGFRYKLARNDEGLFEVVTLYSDEKEEDTVYEKFVKNGAGETINFEDYNFALYQLNKWFPRNEIAYKFQQDYIPMIEASDDENKGFESE